MKETIVKSATIAAIQVKLDEAPMIRLMGIKAISVDQDSLICEMPLTGDFTNDESRQFAHGGIIAALIDSVVTFAALIRRDEHDCKTANLRVDYLRPATGACLRCTASSRRIGRTLATVDADVFDDRGTLVAVGRASIAIVRSIESPNGSRESP